MATINLGSIKFKWQGAYNAGTAYTVDDVVSYNGSSYICILASTGNLPTNATYWEQMSQKGTDADLLSVAGTQSGDLYFNNSGTIDRLAIGSAGQALKVNSGANGFEFGTAGGILQVKQKRSGATAVGSTEIDNNNFTSGLNVLEVAITPSSASSYLWVTGMLHIHHVSDYEGYWWLTYHVAGGSEKMIAGNANTSKRRTGRVSGGSQAGGNMTGSHALDIMFAPNTTSEVTIRCRIATSLASTPTYFNRDVNNTTNDDDGGNTLSTLTVSEVAGGISPNISDDTVYEGV